MRGEEGVTFLDYILNIEVRFLQERTLGLDLYHSGFWGIAVFCLAVASVTVFLLAIFHIIPSRKHIVALLLGLGGVAAALGLLGTYIHFTKLPAVATAIIRETAGRRPLSAGEEAAVLALPVLVGGITLATNLLGCLYLAVFWSSSLFRRRKPSK